ncbi:site-specific DNA-methyltransferase [Nannocystis radixulma]|uniref:site-specific DNA-methyltransferase (adenine-specific) n=1 Tax=Nannocystis radixulma TaxID=2995305 RepID=A0ABT5BKZ9_9BACT|nr:site-specific DNA-methyltransferase [Nannocystis radixulma]MDC0674358.1 site-specific DNA-methyltransferase [Nannocystis radixulma]
MDPRPLIEDLARSYRAGGPEVDGELYDNRLIRGDNLPALLALESEFAGKIRCVYIDPPYNTGRAFAHYDDGVEHARWLADIRARLEVLRRLLAADGTLFVHIDDNELGYLIVLLDEVFGRANRASVVTFKQGAPTGHKAINPGCVTTSNFVLVYAKDRARWNPPRLFTARERDPRYAQFIVNRGEPHEAWRIVTLLRAFADAEGLAERAARQLARDEPARLDRFVLDHADAVVRLARPDYNAVSAAARAMIDRSKAAPGQVLRLERDDHDDFYFVRGERILFYAAKLKHIDGERVAGEPLTTIWDDLLSNNLHNEGGVAFPKGKKPEALLKRVLELSTRPGDWVLDVYAGSGTTGAVAHKLRRRWILVERGDHCDGLVAARLRAVVDGRDPSGVTAVVGWRGGGGFRYFRAEGGDSDMSSEPCP